MRRALYINCALSAKKLNRIKALFAQVAANAQLAALRCWFLLNAAVCHSLVDTIRYTLQCADCAFGRNMPPNAAKILVNFFLTLLLYLKQRPSLICHSHLIDLTGAYFRVLVSVFMAFRSL